MLVSSALGTLICWRYYYRGYSRVHPLTGKQWRVWLFWSPWYAAWIVFANVFKDRISVAATIAAVASAAPLLGYALLNRRRAALRVSHPRTRLDDMVHQPVRLSILAALASAKELEFSTVRDVVEVSDSLLSST